MKKFESKSWYPYTVAVCAGVILFVALTHLSAIDETLNKFGNYLSPVIIGAIISYIMNPLAGLFERTIFKNMKKGRWTMSVALTFVAIIAVILALILLLVPQLIDSIAVVEEQFPLYQEKLQDMAVKLGLSGILSSPGSTEEVTGHVMGFLKEHMGSITASVSGLFSAVVNVAIGAVLAFYLLNSKTDFNNGLQDLMRVILPEGRYESVKAYVQRCDKILSRYLVFALLDAVLVGVVVAIIMLILRMPYAGLIPVIMGVVNLIPTFGPPIGAAISAFLLLLVSPKYAMMMIAIFIFVQVADGYILQPKLFGNALGVSGVMILISIVVLGNIFGVVGILLAIPVAAVLDFTYKEMTMPAMQRKKEARMNAAGAENECSE